MKIRNLVGTTTTLATIATASFGGGIDRSGQGIGILFEQGNAAELSFGFVAPTISGVQLAPLASASSGNMSGDYTQLGFAYKQNLNNKIDLALIFDQPFGADVDYPAGTGYYAQGATAILKTNAITGIVKYMTSPNISIYGGVRYQTLSAVADLPYIPGGYTVDGETDGGVGYLVGAAYERPDIALRVALTYNSEIDHDLASTETGLVPGTSTTAITTPKSINLDFQTGIAANTLVFGSIRYVEWSVFDISPAGYVTITGQPLVSYTEDTTSYTLGIGRKFNDKFSGAISLGYEAAKGGLATNLGPKDGYYSVGLGGTYTMDNMKINAGIRYVMIGDAQTPFGPVSPAGDFDGNSALGIGMKVTYSF